MRLLLAVCVVPRRCSGADLLSFDDHFAHVDGLAWVHPEGAHERRIRIA